MLWVSGLNCSRTKHTSFVKMPPIRGHPELWWDNGRVVYANSGLPKRVYYHRGRFYIKVGNLYTGAKTIWLNEIRSYIAPKGPLTHFTNSRAYQP